MTGSGDWGWKLREAVDRVRTRYEHIGRKTAAPFLAVVYPLEAERAVVKEWRTLAKTLEPEFDVRPVDILDVTACAARGVGVESLVSALREPMPGSNPEAELGELWTRAVSERVVEESKRLGSGRPVVVLERLAALYPASSPRAVMQALWDGAARPECPVLFLIPGVFVEAPRFYAFVGKVHELMYRGDIL